MSVEAGKSTIRNVKRRCELCGSVFVTTTGGRGRPRVYCPPAEPGGASPCKDLAFALSLLQTNLEAVVGRLTPDRADGLRGALWSAANTCNAVKRRKTAATG